MFYSAVRKLLAVTFKLLYRFTVVGDGRREISPAILAPNHVSFLDPPVVGVAHPTPLHFFARKTLFDNRLLAWFMRSLYAEPISRGKEGAKALVKALKLLKEGKSVVLFPEGTRSRTGELLPLNRGVVNLSLKSGVPILPLYLFGTREVWPPEKKFPKLFGRVGCAYGKPIDPKEYSSLCRQEALDAMLDDLQKALAAMQKEYEKME